MSDFWFKTRIPIFSKHYVYPNFNDVIAFLFIMTVLTLVVIGVEGMHQKLTKLAVTPIELSLYNLPKYALYTTLRMFAAIIASLIFTLIVATFAAKNKRAEMIIIPALDILQSVPVLGFLSFTVTSFMRLFPGNEAGVELAAVFAVFTSQVWNMTFSFYQSLRTVPRNLVEVSYQFGQNSWQRFWRLEIPYAIPGLVWNTMMSMSGGWFFVVASEAISVGNTQIYLPGIGSWLGLAIKDKNIVAVGWSVLAMAIIILLYDQLLFRPIIAWADRFNMGETACKIKPKSWVYDVLCHAKILNHTAKYLNSLKQMILAIRLPRIHFKNNYPGNLSPQTTYTKLIDVVWKVLLYVLTMGSILFLLRYLRAKDIDLPTILNVVMLGGITMLRVLVLVLIATLIWVPVGVYVGLQPKLVAIFQPIAQFLAAFPANILFPFVVMGIVAFHLNPDIWLSPLIILGTQWYIFFNVVAGASVFPNDLKEAAAVYKVRSWAWWRKVILPGIFPYYVTGAITASGGSWNASIVAEVATWGSTTIQAHGLGAYIANATNAGDMSKVLLGVGIMSFFVIVLNKFLWSPLYYYASKLTGSN